jgi:hypothetical protein
VSIIIAVLQRWNRLVTSFNLCLLGYLLLLIYTIIHHSVHQVLAMSHSLGLATKAILQYILLMDVQRFILICIQNVFRSILHNFIAWLAGLQRHEVPILYVKFFLFALPCDAKEHLLKFCECILLLLH